jgi:lysophospholipase L1-like esterase
MPGTGARLGQHIRWTGVCQQILGSGYRILEEGLPGRTTVYDDPCDSLMNGLDALGYTLASQKPVDLVVLFLGTNDIKFTDAYGVASGIDTLLHRIVHANVFYQGSCPIFMDAPKILLIAPPRVLPQVDQAMPDSRFTGKAPITEEFPRLYQQMAKKYGTAFLDANEYVELSPVDCLHLDETGHKSLVRPLPTQSQNWYKKADCRSSPPSVYSSSMMYRFEP